MAPREMFLQFAKGFSTATVVFGILMLILGILASSDEKPQKGVESPRFGVVDHYRNCDVVRYEPEGAARYSYFLDCNKR